MSKQLSEAEAWREIAKRLSVLSEDEFFDTSAAAQGITAELWEQMDGRLREYYDRNRDAADYENARSFPRSENIQASIILTLWLALDAEEEGR